MAVSVLPPARVSKLSLSTLAWRRLHWHRGKSYQEVCQQWRATARVYFLALILLVWPKYPNQVRLGQALLFSHWASWKQPVHSPAAQHRELVNLSWLWTSTACSFLLPAPGAQDRCSDPARAGFQHPHDSTRELGSPPWTSALGSGMQECKLALHGAALGSCSTWITQVFQPRFPSANRKLTGYNSSEETSKSLGYSLASGKALTMAQTNFNLHF